MTTTTEPTPRLDSDEPMLHAALNGDREHSATPRAPADIAAQASAAVVAGAQVVHLHPFDEEGRQTFDAEASPESSRSASCFWIERSKSRPVCSFSTMSGATSTPVSPTLAVASSPNPSTPIPMMPSLMPPRSRRS